MCEQLDMFDEPTELSEIERRADKEVWENFKELKSQGYTMQPAPLEYTSTVHVPAEIRALATCHTELSKLNPKVRKATMKYLVESFGGD